MTDLRIIVDDPAGLRVQPIGAYEGWELNSVQWIDDLGGNVVDEGALFPDVFTSAEEIRAVAQVTGPNGETATLTMPSIYVSGAYPLVSVDIVRTETVDSFPFSFASVEGMASSVIYEFGSMHHNDARVIFNDGRTVEYLLDPNDPSIVRQAVEHDFDANFGWSERIFEYDEQERSTRKLTLYDDDTADIFEYRYEADLLVQETHTNRLGLRDDKYFEAGVITSHQRVDQLDTYNFTSDLRSYENGVISARNMELDNGVGISWSYSNGVLQYRAASDIQDQFSYDSIVTFYEENGQRKSQTITYDDNAWLLQKTYVDGALDFSERTDLSDAFGWNTRSTSYRSPSEDVSQDNMPFFRFTVYDEGHTNTERYGRDEDGRKILISSRDDDVEDAFNWDTRDRAYDEDGQLSRRTLTEDNGVVTQTNFFNGLRSIEAVNDLNDTKSFTSILRLYDEGDLHRVSTTMDDGRLIERQYDHGELSTVTSEDRDDAFVWAERLDTYSAGELSTRATLFDNGVMQNEQFDQGQLTYRERLDESDAHRWHSITEQFEDGLRVSRDVVWDDDLIV